MIINKTSLLKLLLLLVFFLQSCEKKKIKSPKIKIHSPEILRIKDIADDYFDLGKYDSSFYYFNKLKKNSEVQKDTALIIYSLYGIARHQTFMGDYSGSESTLIESFPLMENTNKYPNGKRNIYTSLAFNYLSNQNYKQALYYYNKSKFPNNDVLDNALINNNIALIFIKTGKYQKAKEILLPLISKKEIINESIIYSRLLENLGYSYLKMGNHRQSIIFLNKSLKISTKVKDKIGISTSYFYLAKYYKERNLKLANQYALLAYNISSNLNTPDDRLESLQFLIKNNTGNKSKKYTLIYLKLNDSIQKVRQKAKNQFAKIKYDFKKEKDENEKLKAQRALEQEQQTNKNLFFYFIIIIGLLGTFFFILLFSDKGQERKN